MGDGKHIPPNGRVILLECIEEGVREALCGRGLPPAADERVVCRVLTEVMTALDARFVMDWYKCDLHSGFGPDIVAALCEGINIRREVIKLRREVDRLMESK